MPKKTKNQGPKSYTGSYRDHIAGIQFKLNKMKIVVTREEFISYLTQAMYTFSRSTTVQGIGKMADGTVIRPKGIGDYFILAGAIAPKSAVKEEFCTFSDGYKLVIGGRLLVAPNGAEDRYVYDCGNLSAWTRFYGDAFSRLSARDVLLLHKLYALCFSSNKTADGLEERLRKATETLMEEAFNPIPKGEHFPNIAKFFLSCDPEMIIETSYRHMAVHLSNEIIQRDLTDATVSGEVKRLITENPASCSIAILPLMLTVILIAEQGRNYTAILTNLALFDLIERQIEIPKVGKIGWLTALATEKMMKLFHVDPRHKNGRKQAMIGGWVTMSHTGSQGESRVIDTDRGKIDFGELPLAQMVGDPHINMSLLHPLAKIQLAVLNHIMAPHQKANKSRDKAFIILASWLHSTLKAAGTVKLLSPKEIRLARQNDMAQELSQVQKKNKLFLFYQIFPILINILNYYEAVGTSAYAHLQQTLEDELGCIRFYASRNDNSQFVAVIYSLEQKYNPTSFYNRKLDYVAMKLRHKAVKYIQKNKNRFRDVIMRALNLPNLATDTEINEYCSRMHQYTKAGDEVTLLAISKLVHRPIVVMQHNEQEEIVGLVYGLSSFDMLNLDEAIVLTHNKYGHYDLVEHRISRELSSLIQHNGPILETVSSYELTELQRLWSMTKGTKQFQHNYIFRKSTLESIFKPFTEAKVKAAFKPPVSGHQTSEIPESVVKESLLLAQKQEVVGPRTIDDWKLKDVPDNGNCFYHAIIEQMKTMNHPFLAKITEGMVPHLYLRDFLNGTDQGVWAEDENIDEVVRKIPVILAIVDTRAPHQGYVCYYWDEDSSSVITHVEFERPLPDNLPIIRLAATGNHYLSVMSNPILTQGSLRAGFRAPTLHALGSSLFEEGQPRQRPLQVSGDVSNFVP